jgi:hypothetical protein
VPSRMKPDAPPPLTVAVDTEFRRDLTLTVQAAARIAPDTLAVQVYRSLLVPELPDPERLLQHPSLMRFRERGLCDQLVVRPDRILHRGLSPATPAIC